MSTISDAELADCMVNGAVKQLNIIQTEEGKYAMTVNLTWKQGDLSVMTTRGKPREWASLDRLVRHISENLGGSPPAITLSLYETEKSKEPVKSL